MPGRLHLIYHTVAWQYLPAEAQIRGEAALASAGGRATSDAPLARFGMEANGSGAGAALSLQLRPKNVRIDFGRFDLHRRWMKWQAPEAS